MDIKNAVVTGGGTGIGRACVQLLAESGCNVAVLYSKSEKEAAQAAEQAGGMSYFAKCDVSKAEECDAALSDAYHTFGGIDLLINCAGVSIINPVADTTDEDYRRVFAVNMDGAFYMTRATLPFFLKAQSGSIVNVSSMWGISGASCEAAYSASKAALIGFTKSCAKEFAPSGVRVNCVAPGVIDTSMNAALSQQDKNELAASTPLGRLGSAREVAQAILFLAAADFITGQILSVDGGFIL